MTSFTLTPSLSHRGRGGRLPVVAALLIVALVALATIAWSTPALAHRSKEVAQPRLPKIGPAPGFSLTTQDGKPLSLSDLRGEVVAVTFIFASCTDTCPMLTAKLIGIQRRLKADLKSQVSFAAITVDPERDTPEVLKRYAQLHGADLASWAFLTGTPAEIRDVARRYGVVYRKQPGKDVDHTFLTSLIDRAGTLRVQYLGVRFNPEEFLHDLRSLLREVPSR